MIMVIDLETFDAGETADVLLAHGISFAIEIVQSGLPDGLLLVAVATTEESMHRVCEVLDLDFAEARVLYDLDAK